MDKASSPRLVSSFTVAVMGITVFYQGKLKDTVKARAMFDSVRDIATEMGWNYEALGSEGRDGLILTIDERAQSLDLTIDSDLMVDSCMKVGLAPAVVHLAALVILRRIEPHFESLKITDELEIWGTAEEQDFSAAITDPASFRAGLDTLDQSWWEPSPPLPHIGAETKPDESPPDLSTEIADDRFQDTSNLATWVGTPNDDESFILLTFTPSPVDLEDLLDAIEFSVHPVQRFAVIGAAVAVYTPSRFAYFIDSPAEPIKEGREVRFRSALQHEAAPPYTVTTFRYPEDGELRA